MLSGSIAAVVGFGIGSILTPLLALSLGLKLAVAAVSVPHAVATALRFWLVRDRLDRRVFLSFGVMSALGGLAGASLHSMAGDPVLTLVFGLLLTFVGVSGLTGLSDRMRFGRTGAWVGGALSGLLGGLVGNQGGIRSAALLGFDVRRDAFVATSTAVALVVDAARVPVYVLTLGPELLALGDLMLWMSLAVVAGTLLGLWFLRRVPESLFRRLVAAVVLLLGVFTLSQLG